MSGQTADFLSRYIENFHNLKGIVVSDNEGMHICSNFEPELKSSESEKLIKTSILLIEAHNQADDNLQKIHSKKLINLVNYYYGDYLIHILKEKNLKISLFFTKNSSIMRAKEISTDLARVYEALNVKIPDIKKDI